MPSSPCPQCHTPTKQALGKTYCPGCGWNREAAEKRTRLLLRLLPVLVILFDAPLIVWIFVGHAQLPILALLGIVTLVPAILVVIAMRGKVRLGIKFGEEPGAKPSAPAPGASPSTNPSASVNLARDAESEDSTANSYAALTKLQRPRVVQMSPQGKMNVTVISLALVVLTGLLIALAIFRPKPAGGSQPNPLIYGVPFVVLILVGLVMRRSLARQKQLLSYGEIASARITKQWDARNGHGIRYEFKPRGGKSITSIATDYSRSLAEGATVPVFYDPENPENQLALCGAFYEIAPLKSKSRA